MAQLSLKLELNTAIATLRWLERLSALDGSNKFLFLLNLFEHNAIKSFVLSGSLSKQILNDILALRL